MSERGFDDRLHFEWYASMLFIRTQSHYVVADHWSWIEGVFIASDD